jgi:hypothetical protein
MKKEGIEGGQDETARLGVGGLNIPEPLASRVDEKEKGELS